MLHLSLSVLCCCFYRSQFDTCNTQRSIYKFGIVLPQDELVAGGYMRPPPEAALEGRAASKSRKAQKRGKAKSTEGSPREFTSPSGFKVCISCYGSRCLVAPK